MEAVVTFDYDAQQDDELTLREGQVIQNVREVEEGWAEGELLGKVGLFPDNFVEMRKAVPEESSPPPEIKEGVCCCISCAHTLTASTHTTQGSHGWGSVPNSVCLMEVDVK